MNFVAVDLGASDSRYTTESGQIMVMPNNMVFLPEGELSLLTPDASDIESCLEVQIRKVDGPACEYLPANVLIGIMAERHGKLNERPSAQAAKSEQKINYVSTLVACALSRLKFGVDEDIDLYLDVPPLQIHKARAEGFGALLPGNYVVYFPKYMGGAEVKVNIKTVNIFEEALMALTSFFFNMNGTLKEQNKKYFTGTTLSLDIGASTSDMAITQSGRYMDKSGNTYMIGGNVARDALADSIRERFVIDLPIDILNRTMIEGRLQSGNKYDDVSDLVSEAKVDLAQQLVAHLQTYFERKKIPLRTVNTIVVSGGGSVQSQYVNADGEVVKTSEPMSYFVTKELTKISDGTEVVEYGEDARFANIKGLFIRAKIDQVAAAKAKTAAIAKQVTATPVAPAPAPVAQATAPAVAPATVTPVTL